MAHSLAAARPLSTHPATPAVSFVIDRPTCPTSTCRRATCASSSLAVPRRLSRQTDPLIAEDDACRRQYYVINPDYSADMSMSIKTPPPPSRDSLDPDKPILVLTHAGTSSANSFIHQVRQFRHFKRFRELMSVVCRSSGILGFQTHSTSSASTRGTTGGQKARGWITSRISRCTRMMLERGAGKR